MCWHDGLVPLYNSTVAVAFRVLDNFAKLSGSGYCREEKVSETSGMFGLTGNTGTGASSKDSDALNGAGMARIWLNCS